MIILCPESFRLDAFVKYTKNEVADEFLGINVSRLALSLSNRNYLYWILKGSDCGDRKAEPLDWRQK